jgi:murein DD-endopeptidase MepM/ murein hydrolase activator NlpD
VRLFPRTARHRLAAASAAASLAIGALAVPLAHAEDLKDRQKQVQGRIHRADHALDESSGQMRRAAARLEAAQARYQQARAELRAVQARLDAAEVRDRAMQVRLQAAVERLAEARHELDAGQAAVDAQRRQVTDTITSIYEGGAPELIALSSLMDAQSPEDLTRQAEARDVVVGRETRAYDDLHAAEVLLQVRETEVEAARDDVAVQRRAAAVHLVTMRELTAQTRAAKRKVQEYVATRRAALAAAARARRQDQAVLARLRQREDSIRDRILAAARRAARSNAGYHGRSAGLLSMPVNGPVTSPFGYRVHPIYHYYSLHDGTDFGAGCGQPLHAVAGGTVMSEYYSAVWGNRLYLNLGTINGKNVTVIYNHLSRYAAGRGESVGRGEVIGYVGTTGWSTGCHLHFTVMVNGNPVDPMPWL